MNKKFQFFVLSNDMFEEVEARADADDIRFLEFIKKETSVITKFNSLSERLVFEDGFKKGFLARDMEKRLS